MESSKFYEVLSKKMAGEASNDELQQLDNYLKAHPEEIPRAEIFASYFHKKPQSTKHSASSLDARWERHLERLQASEDIENTPTTLTFTTTRLLLIRTIFKVAAILLPFAVLLAIWLNYRQEGSHQPSVSTENFSFEAGSKRTKITLKDGTTVWLNQNSKLTYNKNFGEHQRELTLVGEAYFDVHHNPAVPMVVHAKTVDITVKGTAFNVMAYPSDKTVETSLIRGSVQLSTQSDRKMTILLKPNEKISIPVNETTLVQKSTANNREQLENKEILYSINRLKPESRTKLIPEIAWIEDKLIFQSESFSQVALKLERFYGVPVEITDATIAVKKFTGVFFKEDLQEALSALQLTYDFSYESKDGKIVIYKKQ